MAAMLAREELNVAATRALGHYTHEKTPLGAAAALAMLDVVETENLIERSTALGAKTEQLDELFRDTPIVTEVRGLGLALAVELGRMPPSASCTTASPTA